MITVSKRAAKQIRTSMQQSDSEGMSLRLAARRMDDGSLDYAMGFDETDHNDSHSRSNGIDIIVAPTSTELLINAALDYVEMEDGERRFIFSNPNDPSHVPPEGNDTGLDSGS
jgi:iron-sulfur cluster assembly protein